MERPNSRNSTYTEIPNGTNQTNGHCLAKSNNKSQEDDDPEKPSIHNVQETKIHNVTPISQESQSKFSNSRLITQIKIFSGSFTTILYRSKYYLTSLRPGSLSVSLIPVLLGTILAFKTTGLFSFIILFATVLTVISVHAAGNLVNTYCDFMRGIDRKDRKTDDRTLVDSILTPEEVVNLGKFCFKCKHFLINFVLPYV